MKLTNYIRDAFVSAVMQDIPQPDGKKLKAQAQDALFKAMAKPVQAVFKSNPKALKTNYSYGLEDRGNSVLIVADLDMDKVIEPFLQPRKERNALFSSIKGIAYGCSTLRQLKEALPELEKYMPKEDAPTRNLPAVANVVADMVKLGWKGAA